MTISGYDPFFSLPRSPEEDRERQKAFRAFPWATLTIAAILVIAFWVELRWCQPKELLNGDIAVETLVAMGGVSRPLVLSDHQWFRLLTSAFLHANGSHLAMNLIALAFTFGFERLVGSVWCAALFVVSALGGSMMSSATSSANLVSIGASGAILGVCAAQVIFVYAHLRAGRARTRLAHRAFSIIIPTLASLSGAGGSDRIDFANHIGGALAGAASASLLLTIWPLRKPFPQAKWLAWAVVLASTATLVWAAAGPIAHSSCPVPQKSGLAAPFGAR